MPAKVAANTISSSCSTDQDGSQDASLLFYPAYCYNASPTWFTWVKLTAYDIHHNLHVRNKFQAEPHIIGLDNGWIQYQTLLLFYLNHPVQFVQLVGVVVSFDDYFDKFWLFVLDDSSGATIEVNCRKPERAVSVPVADAKEKKEKDAEAEARWDAMARLDIGTVVQVKGLISTFRDVRQLQLERISFLEDTNKEMQLIAARTEFYLQILSSPWRLTEERQKSLRRQALGESRTQREHTRRRHEALHMKNYRDQRHTARIIRQYEKEERKRQDAADKARKAGQRLKSVHPLNE